MISASTKLTAVIGNPIGHSLSPLLHNEIFLREDVDAVMLAFQNADINELVSAMRALPVHLIAVTLPHKESIISLLDEVDEKALAIGSVNTVINTDGKLKGYNTDVVGIAVALKDATLKGKSVLIFGAGGAARAVAYHMKECGAKIHSYDRTFKKAQTLCEKFGGMALELAALNGTQFDVIVNATPVGLHPNTDATPVSKDIIRKGSVVFDLVYNPLETRLMREATEKGAQAISGLTMLVEQALEQERLWLGREIGNAPYYVLLERELNKQHRP
ncbi:MAG: shikimate dehydrogenase [bacterium]|nr:shikimate dehydrogenase [bacterium]